MNTRILGSLLLLGALAPTPALAGFGMTAGVGALSDGTAWAPSLDWREKGWTFNLNAFDTIGGLTGDQLNLGAGFTGVAIKRAIATEVEGTFAPGVRVRYYQVMGDAGKALDKTKVQSSGFNLTGQLRMGMEMKKGMGFGVYVVPQIGVSNLPSLGTVKAADAELGLTYGGGVEISAWFLNK